LKGRVLKCCGGGREGAQRRYRWQAGADLGNDERRVALVLIAAKGDRGDGFAPSEAHAERPVVKLGTELQRDVRQVHGSVIE
jgi:hypothetical protein